MISNIFWIAVNTYHEARGELKKVGTDALDAIGHVVINRAQHDHKSSKEEILQPFQFSWHNGNKFPPIKDYESMIICLESAVRVLGQRAAGENLHGARFYFADYLATRPKWSKNMTEVAHIGSHIFFKE